ncbi:carbohydrate kinase family protein [Halobaculum sp. P14]|uniref:carbohydrate kinase family protein n=1 Tax=Halobaculum sp. P14 TaxID=3421638 RepID=UPI003EBDF2A3
MTDLDVVAVGAAALDRQYLVSNLPEPDGGAYADGVEDTFGGVAANVATGCAQLGRDAGILTRLGRDDVADRVLADLDDGPLDTARVRRKPGTSTHCIVLRDGDGKRSIVTAGDSVKRLRLDEDDVSYLAAADVVFVTAYAPDPVHQTLLSCARGERPAGAPADGSFPPVVFDLSGPPAELDGRGARPGTVDDWLDAAALVVVGDVAAAGHFGCTGRDAAALLAERGADRVASTAGDDGATLVDGDGLVDVPAFDVDAVDETGAGDAYAAGLIHAWLLGDRTATEAGRVAAAAAACNCTEAGARGGQPTADELESFLAVR